MEMDDTAGLAEAAGSRFSSRELIGKGSFGDVYKAFDKELDKEVAIKVIDLEESEDEIDDIQKEISMLSQCRSPYITEYYASYLHQTKLWIVMEYIAGGSVADLLQIGPPLDETSIACILRDLLHAVEYLHNEGKIHRDIKAANILLTENGDVKVADFGVSAQLTRTISRRKTLVGTPFWIAPEVIQNSDGYNEKADIWSLGITTTEMAKWELPLTDLPPMRVLFIIPQENPPQRASAKELLKHRFIRNARKSPRLLERIRERPKYQIKEDADTIRNGPRAIGEGSDIVKVAGNPREETVRASNQGKTMKNAGWDFNIDGSQTTGTVKSAPKPPQARERKPEVPYNQTTRRVSESGSQQSPAFGNVPADLLVKDARHQETNHEDLRLCDNRKESPISGSGTVVVRSLKGSQLSSQYHDQSSLLSSTYASFEDASLSGTFVLHNQHDDHESPRTPKSRLGIQEKASSASIEDSAMNFAEAKAAIRAGFRKGNPRERSALGKLNNDGPDNRRVGKMTTSSVSPRSLPRSHQPSDDEENAKVKLSCAPLSLLLIPSLKEAVSDDPEGSLACAVANSLTIMERSNPGSYEVLISRLLQRSSSSKESSLKDLNELVVQLYARGKVASEEKVESDNEKRQQQNEFHSNTNLSPLARFLLSRWQGQVSRYLNPI